MVKFPNPPKSNERATGIKSINTHTTPEESSKQTLQQTNSADKDTYLATDHLSQRPSPPVGLRVQLACAVKSATTGSRDRLRESIFHSPRAAKKPKADSEFSISVS
ncbi:hypothetical protein CDAR_585681 [Caerostris darwini]|uniref:Uncharacterized protein n=1 Tax=Caerostris darwini TaxID=1538125 RepID=A0AAV4TJV8_9ARAC|nr:hypothetical protein CDAR_585681 [Caerostris darwini]